MAFTDPAIRRSAGARRADYSIAIAVSAALLLMLNARPAWQAIPFLSSGTGQVLWLASLSLAAGTAASVVQAACDPPWVKSAGELAGTGTGTGLAAAIRGWHGCFALSSGWSTAVRVLPSPSRARVSRWRPNSSSSLAGSPATPAYGDMRTGQLTPHQPEGAASAQAGSMRWAVAAGGCSRATRTGAHPPALAGRPVGG